MKRLLVLLLLAITMSAQGAILPSVTSIITSSGAVRGTYANPWTAATAAVSGDTIMVPPGVFDMGDSAITLPANTRLVGAGAGVTIIKYHRDFAVGPAILPANSCVIEDLSLTGYNPAVYQVSIGIALGQTTFTNVTVLRCAMTNETDVINLNYNGGVPNPQMTLTDCILAGKWDTIAVGGGGTGGGTVTAEGCFFQIDSTGASNPDLLSFGDQHVAVAGTSSSIINLHNCSGSMSNALFNQQFVTEVQAGAIIRVQNCSLRGDQDSALPTLFGGYYANFAQNKTNYLDNATVQKRLYSINLSPVATNGTDKAGLDLNISGGTSTGTGRGGSIILKTTPSGTTASTENATVIRSYISAKAVTLTESTATKVCTISLATGKSATVRLFAGTRSDDATNFQINGDTFVVSAVNKAGTITGAISSAVPAASSPSSGTLTTTWTVVDDGSGVFSIKNNAVSSLTQTTLVCTWQMEVITNDTGLTITPQ